MKIRNGMFLATLALTLVAVPLFSLHAEPLAKGLLLPIVPGEELDQDDTEPIDTVLADRMKKYLQIQIHTVEDYQDEFGRTRAVRLLRCNSDEKCIDRRLKRSPYEFVIVGKAERGGEKLMELSFRIFNLLDGETKRKKEFEALKGQFKDDPDAREWTAALLHPPQPLLAKDEERTVARQEEAPAAASPVMRRLPNMASKQSVLDGLKAAYQLFVKGDIAGSHAKVVAVTKKRCGCDADGRAYGFKAMLAEFERAYNDILAALKSANSKAIIDNLEQMKVLEGHLAEEGARLGITEKSKFANEMNSRFAEGYTLMGKGLLKADKYADARATFQKALEYDGEFADAKDQLAKMPQHAQMLFMRGANMVMYDPEAAKKWLEIAVELADPKSDLYDKALEKLEEIKAME